MEVSTYGHPASVHGRYLAAVFVEPPLRPKHVCIVSEKATVIMSNP